MDRGEKEESESQIKTNGSTCITLIIQHFVVDNVTCGYEIEAGEYAVNAGEYQNVHYMEEIDRKPGYPHIHQRQNPVEEVCVSVYPVYVLPTEEEGPVENHNAQSKFVADAI